MAIGAGSEVRCRNWSSDSLVMLVCFFSRGTYLLVKLFRECLVFRLDVRNVLILVVVLSTLLLLKLHWYGVGVGFVVVFCGVIVVVSVKMVVKVTSTVMI